VCDAVASDAELLEAPPDVPEEEEEEGVGDELPHAATDSAASASSAAAQHSLIRFLVRNGLRGEHITVRRRSRPTGDQWLGSKSRSTQ
jgi:hypothetical protein